MTTPWQVRGLQLDLARQMEPVSRILELIDLSAEVGLTHVQLYLEGRVRLPCFAGPLDGGAYDAKELTAIADHARLRGIELIHVVPALGHADLIVSRPELFHLAEEREGRGRFHATPGTFCPSLPESREFIETFCRELCALLPGTELHLGCDEAWNLGFCSRCRERADRDGLSSIYIEHVRWLYELAQRLGRRLWLWDDFLEVFPEALTQLPREILWSHWSYDEAIDPQGIQAHFVNRRRHRWLEQYAQHGAQAVVVPWALAPRNVESLLDHGRRHPAVIGAMLSEWEMAWRGWDERRAVVRAFGALCRNQDPHAAWDEAIAREAPTLTAAQRLLVKAILRQQREPLSTTLNTFLKGPVSTTQQDREALDELLLATLDPGLALTSDLVHGVRVAAEMDLLAIGLQRWLQRAYDPRLSADEHPTVHAALARLAETCDRLGQSEDRRLRQQRPGCLPQGAIATQMTALGDLARHASAALKENDLSNALLMLRHTLPDAHGLPLVQIELFEDEVWRVIYSGSPKPDPRNPGSLATQGAVVQTRRPQRLRITGGGYGGTTVSWCEIITADARWVLDQLVANHGPIDQPARLLCDDSLGCRFGDEDILAQLLDTRNPPRNGVCEWTLKLEPACSSLSKDQ